MGQWLSQWLNESVTTHEWVSDKTNALMTEWVGQWPSNTVAASMSEGENKRTQGRKNPGTKEANSFTVACLLDRLVCIGTSHYISSKAMDSNAVHTYYTRWAFSLSSDTLLITLRPSEGLHWCWVFITLSLSIGEFMHVTIRDYSLPVIVNRNSPSTGSDWGIAEEGTWDIRNLFRLAT